MREKKGLPGTDIVLAYSNTEVFFRADRAFIFEPAAAAVIGTRMFHFQEVSAMSIHWKDSFRIGIVEIDAQHRELFSRLDSLEAALKNGTGSDMVIRTFQFLDNYVNLHFQAEEELQRLYKYPHRAMHTAEHEVFKKRLKNLESRLTTDDPSEQLAAQTDTLLTQWLISHVTSLDKELSGYYKEAVTRNWEKWLTSQF
jgi:hemerythrin